MPIVAVADVFGITGRRQQLEAVLVEARDAAGPMDPRDAESAASAARVRGASTRGTRVPAPA